jgi:hypothetical protein
MNEQDRFSLLSTFQKSLQSVEYDDEEYNRNKESLSKSILPKQVESAAYKIYQVLLDSNDRNTSAYPTPANFILKLATSLNKVFAIRLLKSEYIASTTAKGMYLYLNGYKLLIRNEAQDITTLFARITPGTNDFQSVTSNILEDPYTYICNPIQPRLNRFEIKTLEYDNTLKQDTDFELILHFAIFCYCS